MGEKCGSRLAIVEAVIEANRKQRDIIVERMDHVLGGLSEKVVGVLGLSFKPNTDDVRESPAIEICRRLMAAGASIRAYDPVAIPSAKRLLNGDRIVYCCDAYEAASDVDAILLATEWNEFRNIDLEKIKSLMKVAVIFDTRNVFEPGKMQALGFRYFGTGR